MGCLFNWNCRINTLECWWFLINTILKIGTVHFVQAKIHLMWGTWHIVPGTSSTKTLLCCKIKTFVKVEDGITRRAPPGAAAAASQTTLARTLLYLSLPATFCTARIIFRYHSNKLAVSCEKSRFETGSQGLNIFKIGFGFASFTSQSLDLKQFLLQ